jgi:hypothetical protein
MVVERLGEHERVGDQRAAGVIADQQYRTRGRDVLQAADIGAKVATRE